MGRGRIAIDLSLLLGCHNLDEIVIPYGIFFCFFSCCSFTSMSIWHGSCSIERACDYLGRRWMWMRFYCACHSRTCSFFNLLELNSLCFSALREIGSTIIISWWWMLMVERLTVGNHSHLKIMKCYNHRSGKQSNHFTKHGGWIARLLLKTPYHVIWC